MSYAMTHLIIAYEYASRNLVRNTGLFLLASITPDFVHARADFQKYMKERSHFLQEGVEWGTVFEEEPLKRWYEELRKFYQRAIGRMDSEEEREFLQGYALHILSDIFSCQLLYAPNIIKYGKQVEIFRREYRQQCLAWDYKLYREYAKSDSILEEMKGALQDLEKLPVLEKMELQTILSVGDIRKGLLWQIEDYKAERGKENTDTEFYMISQANSDKLIDYIGKQCDRLLYDFPEVGRIRVS